MLKIMHFQEIVHFKSAENLVTLSWESSLGGSAFGERMFESKTYHDVQDKVEKEININADIDTVDELYTVDVSYPIELELPFGLFDDINIRDVLVSRKWSGNKDTGEVLGFSIMEQQDEDEYVYIFPNYGERYHRGSCYHLSVEGRYFESVGYAYALSKGYSGCEICY